MCVCVCVRERERERASRARVFVCVCVKDGEKALMLSVTISALQFGKTLDPKVKITVAWKPQRK